jgi:hypothetical protein
VFFIDQKTMTLCVNGIYFHVCITEAERHYWTAHCDTVKVSRVKPNTAVNRQLPFPYHLHHPKHCFAFSLPLNRRTSGRVLTTFRQVHFFFVLCDNCGSGSSVRIATDYGLNGPGIESRWGRDFPHLSRPALGPTQPPVQWVQGLSQG